MSLHLYMLMISIMHLEAARRRGAVGAGFR